MGLRDIAEADLAVILEDNAVGPGWPITLTAPDGTTDALVGYSNDISQVIDPETGAIVSGRQASAALRISSILAAGFTGLPVAIADRTSKPWLVGFDDINGSPHTFKVVQSNPDRTLGLVTLILGLYE